MRPLWDLVIPEIQGPERRAFFNQMALWSAASVGLAGAGFGLLLLGLPGAVVGLLGGLWLGGLAIEQERFLRP